MQEFLIDVKSEIIQYYDGLVAIIPKILMALLVMALAWILARQVRRISGRKLKKQMEDPLLAEFLATMIRFVIFIVGLTFSLKIIGLDGITAGILAGAGLTAFVIGFALRDIGENFLAGILMAFKRPFRVGDFVESGVIKGTVLALNVRDTLLKTPDGKDVSVPNALIIKNPLINYTIDGFLRFDFVVGLPEGTDYQKAIQVIESAVSGVEEVLKKRRKTSVNISGISPGKLDVTVSFWIDTFAVKETSDQVRSKVILAVQNALEKDIIK